MKRPTLTRKKRVVAGVVLTAGLGLAGATTASAQSSHSAPATAHRSDAGAPRHGQALACAKLPARGVHVVKRKDGKVEAKVVKGVKGEPGANAKPAKPLKTEPAKLLKARHAKPVERGDAGKTVVRRDVTVPKAPHTCHKVPGHPGHPGHPAHPRK